MRIEKKEVKGESKKDRMCWVRRVEVLLPGLFLSLPGRSNVSSETSRAKSLSLEKADEASAQQHWDQIQDSGARVWLRASAEPTTGEVLSHFHPQRL